MVLVIYARRSPDLIKCHSQSHLSVSSSAHFLQYYHLVSNWQRISSVCNLAKSSFTALTVSNTFSRTAGIGHEKMLSVFRCCWYLPLHLEYKVQSTFDLLLKLMKEICTFTPWYLQIPEIIFCTCNLTNLCTEYCFIIPTMCHFFVQKDTKLMKEANNTTFLLNLNLFAWTTLNSSQIKTNKATTSSPPASVNLMAVKH